jgi:MFS family permease
VDELTNGLGPGAREAGGAGELVAAPGRPAGPAGTESADPRPSRPRQGQRGRHRRRQPHVPLGRRFWWLWTATGCSSIGDGLVLVAFPLLALRYTHDTLLIAGVIFAERLPALLIGLLAGAVADRVSRRRLALTAEWVRLAVLGGFSAMLGLHAGSLAALYVAVFAIGSMDQLYSAATFAALPGLVAPDALGRANGQLFSIDMAGEQVAGQALGGLALAVSRLLPFVLDGASFLGSALLLRPALPAETPARPEQNLRADLVEGLRWFRRHPTLPTLTALIASLAFSQLMVMGVLVLYVRGPLHLSAADYGLLMAGVAVGNVVGGLLAPRINERLGAVPTILGAALIAGSSYLLMGGWARSLVGCVIALVVEALAVPLGNVACATLRQRATPRAMLGRAGMVYRVIVFAAIPLGALVGGALGQVTSLDHVFLAAAVVQLCALAVLAPRLLRAVRTAPVIDLTAAGDRPGGQDADVNLADAEGQVAGPAAGA